MRVTRQTRKRAITTIARYEVWQCSSTELSGTPDREHSGARAQKLELVRIRDLLVEMTQLCAECMRYLVQRSLAFPLILQADY